MSNDFDQQMASIRDTMPRMWWSMYRGSVDAGFSDKQAIALVCAFILSQNPNGIRPDSPSGAGETE